MSYNGTYSIKDLENLSGIRAHTIRIWEKRYEILSPGRSGTNIRVYTNEDLKALLTISLLHKHGHKISRIAGMTSGQRNDLLMSLNLAGSGEADLLDALIAGMIDMDENQITRIFDAAVSRTGFEQAISGIVFPFFSRIGLMWQVGSINPAQEHFVSNLFRQKLLAAIDALPSPSRPLKVVLFLPGTEQHELTLLFYHYALRSRGFNTVYLGQGVPLDSLARIIGITVPDVLVATLTTSLELHALEQLLAAIHQSFPEGRTLLSGPVMKDFVGALPPNIKLFADLSALLGILAR